LRFGPLSAALGGAGLPPSVIAHERPDGRGRSTEGISMTTDRDIPASSPRTPHLRPATSSLSLELHGYRPSRTSPTTRPLPEPNAVGGAVADIFDALIATAA